MKIRIFVVILFFISILTIAFYLGILRYSMVKNLAGNRILVQRAGVLKNNPDCLKSRRWLSQIWSTNETDIRLIVLDKEPWMNICGLLDIQSFQSARVFVINKDHKEGKGWISTFERWNTPHSENIYIIHEFKPKDQQETSLSARFYSRPNYWRDNIFGELAIIEKIVWSDNNQENGEIIAYQSQKILPSISVQVNKSAPRLWHTFPTPLGSPIKLP